MKKLTGFVIILAVLILGGYYGMGVLTERTIKNNMQIINQSNTVYADVVDYHRGLFTSTAKIKWSIHIPERAVKGDNGQVQTVPAEDFQLDLPITVHHGPVIFADNKVKFGMGYAESVIEIPEKYMKDFTELFTPDSDKPKLLLSIFVDYFNKSSIGANVPAFNVSQKNGNGKFSWLGLDANTSIASNVSTVIGHINLEGFKAYDTPDGKVMQVGKVRSKYNLHQSPNGLFLGTADFNIKSIDASAKKQVLFKLENFDANSKSDIANNLFYVETGMSLKSVMADGKTYGPGQLLMSLKNLDAEILAQINQQANAMQNGSEADRQKALLAILPLIPKLFSKGPEFAISKLSVKFPQGVVEGNLQIKIPEGEVTNPMELVTKVQGSSKLKLPVELAKFLLVKQNLQQLANQPEMEKALIQELQANQAAGTQPQPSQADLAAMATDKQLKGMEQAGLLVLQGTDYVVEMSLEQGKVIVNGKPFDPSMMKF